MSSTVLHTPATHALHHEADVSTAVRRTSRISWPAILAGAVMALAVQILLAMLGTGIGLSTLDPLAAGDSPTAGAFGIGAAVWWGVSSLVALFAGGWVASRLSGMLHRTEGALHGLLTWAVALLVTVYLVSSAAGALVRGAAGVLGTAASVTATAGAAVAPKIADAAGDQLNQAGISFDSIKSEAMKILSQTGKPELQPGSIAQQAGAAAANARQAVNSPATGDQDYLAILQRVLTAAKGTVSQVDREALNNVVAARAGISREEAAKRVDGWIATADQARSKAAATAEQAKQNAREAADATAKGVSRATLLGFFVLALGGLAAWVGGSMGLRREDSSVQLHRDITSTAAR